jgi:catechol 2,3-dioxygenase-like lactoylglutathione lyase family enzyme
MVSISFSDGSLTEGAAAMVIGLDLLFLEVNSLEESLAFYCNQLGFAIEKSNPDSDPPMATIRAGRFRITLVEHLETMLRRGRGAHFFVGVKDVDAYHEQLRERGLITPAPADEGWGGRFITVEDPDKYRFFFVTWADNNGPGSETVSALAATSTEE